MMTREKRAKARASWPVRRLSLAEAGNADLSAVTTAEERLAMMWPLAVEAWTLAGRTIPDYPRNATPIRVLTRAQADLEARRP